MLRTFFDAVEKTLGSSLDGLGTFAWNLGLLLVAVQALAPFVRLVLELAFARAGLERTWVVTCANCSGRSPLGGDCLRCGQPLPVSPVLRLFARGRRSSRMRRSAGQLWSMIGAFAFVAGSLWLVALEPAGPLERLFAGAAAFAWAAIGLFVSRALGPRGQGPIARARELALAGVGAALLGSALFLQQTVHPLPERVLSQVRAAPNTVELDGTTLPISSPELGFEFQLVEHPGLGLARVLPLAWVGGSRSPIVLPWADAWLRDATWKNANTLRSLGLHVKRRTETFPVSAGERYEVVLFEREAVLRAAH